MEYTCPYCGAHQDTAKKPTPSGSNFPWLLVQDMPQIRNNEYMQTDYCDACKKPVALFKDDAAFKPYKTCGGEGLNQIVGVDCPYCENELIITVSGDFTPVGIVQQQQCKHCGEMLSVEIEPDGHVQVQEIPAKDYPCPYCGENVSFAGVPEDEFLAAFCNHCDALLAVVKEGNDVVMEKTYENDGTIDEDFFTVCPECGRKNLPQVGVHPVNKTFHVICNECETHYHYGYDSNGDLQVSKD